MNGVWCFVLGVLVSGPLWAAVAVWASRRVWSSAKRLSARAKGRDHLVELGKLAGGLAHEIKNPLSTINVNLKLLSEDLQRYHDEDHGRCLRRLRSVQAEADRLRAILDDFLRYAGRYEMSLSVQDVRAMVGELADFFAPQAQAGHVVLRTALSDTPVYCSVDANLIKQALLNLMINATQAMTRPDGGQAGPGHGGELLIRVQASRGQAVIEVIDTGPGISPEVIERIWEVYFSTKKGGSGLGLPTTRRIIREHEGTIRVESEIGRGTRFVITLPLAPTPPVVPDPKP